MSLIAEPQFFRFDVLESDHPCGYGNVTIDGQSLQQDGDGAGSGPLTTEHGNVVTAKWQFHCVQVDGLDQEQVMDLSVLSIDENRVRDSGFSVHFQQVAPATVSGVEGARSIIKVPATDASSPGSDDRTGTDKGFNEVDLQMELIELESMRARMDDLKLSISEKERFISENFDSDIKFPHEAPKPIDCATVKCKVRDILTTVHGMFTKLFRFNGDDGRSAQKPLHAKLDFDHNHGPRNHTWPHHPHHQPPHCHCLPPPPPHRGHGAPPPPHHPHGAPPPPPPPPGHEQHEHREHRKHDPPHAEGLHAHKSGSKTDGGVVSCS